MTEKADVKELQTVSWKTKLLVGGTIGALFAFYDFAVRPQLLTTAFHSAMHAAGAYVTYWLLVWCAYLVLEAVFLFPLERRRGPSRRWLSMAVAVARIGLGLAFVWRAESSGLPESALLLAIVAPAGLYALAFEPPLQTDRNHAAPAALVCWMALFAVGAVSFWIANYSERSQELAGLMRWAGPAVLLACTLPVAVRKHKSLRTWAWTASLIGGAAVISLFARGPVAGARPVGARPEGPRRVIVITVDTLRADALSCYDPSAPATPNLDRLARDGVLFREAYSPASWTLPSMASLLTGASPLVHGVSLPVQIANLPSIAEYFRAAGYDTAGLFGNPILARQLRIGEVDRNAVFDYGAGFGTARFYEHKRFGQTAGGEFYADLFGFDSIRGSNTEGLADRTIARFRSEGSLLSWTHFHDPHWPYAPPPRYLPSAKVPQPSIGPIFDDPTDVRIGYRELNPEERLWVRALYLAEVRFVDDAIGRILDALRDEGAYEDALIVVTSDHGEEFWEHDRFGHGHSLHRESLRTPLIIKTPGGPSGRVIETPVETRALLPTLLELCGIPHQPEAFWPGSLVPLILEKGGYDSSAPVIASGVDLFENEAAIRIGDLRYIRKLYSGTESLFDLSTDPGETRSVLYERPEDAERMRRALDRHLGESQRLRQSLGLSEGATQPFDNETLKRLRSLGYL